MLVQGIVVRGLANGGSFIVFSGQTETRLLVLIPQLCQHVGRTRQVAAISSCDRLQ